MTTPLSHYEVNEYNVVRFGTGPRDLAVVTSKTPMWRSDGASGYSLQTISGKESFKDVLYRASEEDIRFFIENNELEWMPGSFHPTRPEETLEHILALRDKFDRQVKLIRQYTDIRKERERRVKRKASKASRAAKEQEAFEMYKDVEVGDIVKVIGVKNTAYPYRLVTDKGSGSFTGIQYGRPFDRKNDRHFWKRGDHMTTTMANKIRKVIKKEEHGQEFP